jgi:hypothetical protein
MVDYKNMSKFTDVSISLGRAKIGTDNNIVLSLVSLGVVCKLPFGIVVGRKDMDCLVKVFENNRTCNTVHVRMRDI